MLKPKSGIFRKLGASVAVVLILLTSCTGSNIPDKDGSAPVKPSASFPEPKNGLVQTSDGGGVTINVEWRGLSGGTLVFGVTMDTHSGSVDQYDLKTLAFLKDASGKIYRPDSWEAPAGGHHRSGTLTFRVSDSLNPATARYVVMVIKDTAGVKERDLKWILS